MSKWLIAGLVVTLLGVAAPEAAAANEEVKGLDEQVQEIKGDVLAIAAELSRLEEKLLYPSDTQVALFVSLAKEESLRLDAVEIALAGKPVVQHLYTFKELEALQKGGVQRIYTGNLTSGEHELQVTLIGKTAGGAEVRRSETFRISKEVGPKIVELAVTGAAVVLKDR